jgi:hypothetical protein
MKNWCLETGKSHGALKTLRRAGFRLRGFFQPVQDFIELFKGVFARM